MLSLWVFSYPFFHNFFFVSSRIYKNVQNEKSQKAAFCVIFACFGSAPFHCLSLSIYVISFISTHTLLWLFCTKFEAIIWLLFLLLLLRFMAKEYSSFEFKWIFFNIFLLPKFVFISKVFLKSLSFSLPIRSGVFHFLKVFVKA